MTHEEKQIHNAVHAELREFEEFKELVKRMREAQETFHNAICAEDIDEIELCQIRAIELEREVDEYLKKMDMKAEDWIKVDRDKWGFLADGIMEQMYDSLPVIVWDSRDEKTEYIDQDNWYDWLSDLEGKPYYSHYLPIVLPKED